MSLWQRLDAALAEKRRGCLITLASVEGSSPRETGTRMLLIDGGGYSGTIGGGALEWQALAFAQSLLAEAPDGKGVFRSFSLGPDLGQCCGGRVQVLFEALSVADRTWVTPLAIAETLGPFATRGHRDARSIFPREVAEARPSLALTFAGDTTLIERHGEPRTPLLLFGAGHVGRALVLALAPLPFAVRWIDTRPDAFPGVQPANVMPILARDPLAELATALPGTLLLAMTHSHALDFDLIAAGLANPAVTLVGVIGSATKRARFASRLSALGLSPNTIDRMICPIGLPALRDKAPAVIAAGIVVQLLEARDEAARQGAMPASAAARMKSGQSTGQNRSALV
ncbi:MAG: xanthine dehydrogenase accessory protein XdhC [Rhizobiales bacterium PAR1]|nr:MAG: xanthine dehydrogenase accessory protein XdhC [Rhizobiales bacterium PAR1]